MTTDNVGKEIFKYVDDVNEYLYIFYISEDKVIVKRYKLTLDNEMTFE